MGGFREIFQWIQMLLQESALQLFSIKMDLIWSLNKI
jgi:hypothetical protein